MRTCLFSTIIFCFSVFTIQAEVVTDGTLGNSTNLPGPDFQITSDLGQQHGGNLFHSFQDFNLQSHESATFSGPNSIQNIIGRVTGGNPSMIDGLIRSTIPNADVYFLNPYGILFGPNAQLDVQGGFHASTADYLQLGENGRFDARNPNDSVLTVAPVEAFGFLTDNPMPIKLHESQLVVPFKKELSLIGGDLLMTGKFLRNADDAFHPNYTVKVYADFGRINLVSLASSGKVFLTPTEVVIEAEKLGNISTENTWIGVSGEGAGTIFVRGKHFKFYQSELEGDSQNEENGMIHIQVDDFELEGAEIATDIHGTGQGGKIVINVNDTLKLSSSAQDFPSFIFSGTEGYAADAGQGGQITIKAQQIMLEEGARISSFSQGPGNGGSIFIEAEILAIQGKIHGDLFKNNKQSEPNTGTSGLVAHSVSTESNAGNAGSISIQATKIYLTSKGVITASASNASGGNITITVPNLLLLQNNSQITTSVSSGKGNGGNITIDHPQFVVLNQGQIKAQADAGQGGNIRIIAEQFIPSANSLISASSRLGIDGQVNINALNNDISNLVITLTYPLLDEKISTLCKKRSGEESSHFYVYQIHGQSLSPEGWYSSPAIEVY